MTEEWFEVIDKRNFIYDKLLNYKQTNTNYFYSLEEEEKKSTHNKRKIFKIEFSKEAKQNRKCEVLKNKRKMLFYYLINNM